MKTHIMLPGLAVMVLLLLPVACAPAAPATDATAPSQSPATLPAAEAPAPSPTPPPPTLPPPPHTLPTPTPTPAPPTPTSPAPTATPAGPTPTPMAFSAVKDVPYTSERTLDVYAPTAPGPWPVVVTLHGGGLDAQSMAALGQAVAGRGVVVFAPNFRSRESNMLDGVAGGWEDAACAIRFARANAAGYGGDAAKVLVVGHSVGGTAGAVMALAGDDFRGDCLVQEGSALADGFVGLDGAYSILSYVQKWIVEKHPAEEWARIDPYSQVERVPVRDAVEYHLFAGFEDELDADARSLQAALETAGYKVQYTRLPDVDHMGMASGLREETVRDIAAFAQRLGPAPRLTITFTAEGCEFTGPEQVEAGDIAVRLVAEADDYYVYAAVAATLDPDRTIADLTTWSDIDPPDWLEPLASAEALPHGTATLALKAPPGPLYFVCFGAHPERKIGAVGPVDVAP